LHRRDSDFGNAEKTNAFLCALKIESLRCKKIGGVKFGWGFAAVGSLRLIKLSHLRTNISG
jgi:hypothetical protein